jgi:two-component system, chemotaxis family, CheB/CheR fusion protein
VAFQFQQLIHLLIENAFKFSRAEVPPEIKINCRMEQPDEAAVLLPLKKQYCHITIADNGIGFDPCYKHQVFEIFKQLNQRQEYSGTGIGLAIAKKIVENHNGLIMATAEVNNGATFDLYIPVDSESSDC